MSFDGIAERDNIIAALKVLVGGRVYNGLPDDFWGDRDFAGGIDPFITIQVGRPFASALERGLAVGERQQPHIMSITVNACADDQTIAEDVSGEIMDVLLDLEPNGSNATPLAARGGYSLARQNSQHRPTRFSVSSHFRTTINMSTVD